MSDDGTEQQQHLFAASGSTERGGRGRPAARTAPAVVHEAFDPTRLTQARNLAGKTKKWLADELGVTPVR